MAYKDPTDQHRDTALGQHQVFRYRKPENITAKKATVQLCQSDLMRGRVQVITEGGENALHSHKGVDGFWMVLKGKVRFYGPDDRLIGEFGPHEGILMPRGEKYWFERCGDGEELELLQIHCYEKGTSAVRVAHGEDNDRSQIQRFSIVEEA